MSSTTGSLRRRMSRALLLTSASALMLGVGLPAASAQAATSSPSQTSQASSSSDRRFFEECYDYRFDRRGDHYYGYCYEYFFKDRDHDGRRDRDERYYKSFELFYYYFDQRDRKHFDSCYYEHDFGFRKGERPFLKYCRFDDDRNHDGRKDRDGHDDFDRHDVRNH